MALPVNKTPKASLPGSDFIQLGEVKPQANVLIYGHGGSGKSTMGLFAPSPVAFINFDKRARHAVKNAERAGRKVHYMEVDFPANVTRLGVEEAKKIGQAAVNKVIKNFAIAVEMSLKGDVRTIVLDTGTEYGEILKIAITGRADRVKDYGQSKDLINREFWRLCNMARESEANFIMLSRAKEIWENSEPTGKFTWRGPDVMNDAVDWSAHIRLKKGRVKGKVKKEFEIEITKAGVNIDELGEVYSSEDWEPVGGPFVHACMMQYPGTGPEDWE